MTYQATLLNLKRALCINNSTTFEWKSSYMNATEKTYQFFFNIWIVIINYMYNSINDKLISKNIDYLSKINNVAKKLNYYHINI